MQKMIMLHVIDKFNSFYLNSKFSVIDKFFLIVGLVDCFSKNGSSPEGGGAIKSKLVWSLDSLTQLSVNWLFLPCRCPKPWSRRKASHRDGWSGRGGEGREAGILS